LLRLVIAEFVESPLQTLVIGLNDSRQFFNQWEAKRLKTALK